MDWEIWVAQVIIYGLSSTILLALHTLLTFRDEEKSQICLKAISSTILDKGKKRVMKEVWQKIISQNKVLL